VRGRPAPLIRLPVEVRCGCPLPLSPICSLLSLLFSLSLSRSLTLVLSSSPLARRRRRRPHLTSPSFQSGLLFAGKSLGLRDLLTTSLSIPISHVSFATKKLFLRPSSACQFRVRKCFLIPHRGKRASPLPCLDTALPPLSPPAPLFSQLLLRWLRICTSKKANRRFPSGRHATGPSFPARR